jgi:hypothetical protein
VRSPGRAGCRDSRPGRCRRSGRRFAAPAGLGLGDKVDGDGHRVSGLVSDDGRLGWTGENIDPYLTKKHAFGFSNIRITRADQDIGGFAAVQPHGHGSHRMHAAHFQDHIGTGNVHRIGNSRVDAVTTWR